MTAVIVRIALRYLAAYLVAKGVLDQALGDTLAMDPDFAAALTVVVGFLIGAATEGWYWLAKKFGWTT